MRRGSICTTGPSVFTSNEGGNTRIEARCIGLASARLLQRCETGSTIVEFALTASLLLVMVFGIVDFGRALYAYHYLSNAAREATRWAAVNGSTCNLDNSCSSPAQSSDVNNYVKGITPLGIDWSQVTVATTWPGTGAGSCATTNAPGCNVQVTVSYNFSFLVPLVHNGSITMSSTSEMVIAH